MCGIAGGFIAGGITRNALQQALASLRHRGPDDVGFHLAGEAALGARRLAIIDLEGGQQPSFNEDGTIVVVQNGEIYNYRELRAELVARGHVFRSESDTEVLVHGYEEWREGLPARLRGMFAFAVWDAKNHALFLARDRFGKKPLFYSHISGMGLLFASEIKALRCLASPRQWSIREQSIYDYLSLLSVPQPHTIYNEVMLLPAGSSGVFRGGVFRLKFYWDLDRQSESRLSYPEATEAVRQTIATAVRLRLRSDVPLGVFLSGGIDSSIVAYEAARVLGSTLRTFTVELENSTLNEAPVAERTARALGIRNDVIRLNLNPTDLLERLVPHFDQPFADASAIPTYAVALEARRHVTVMLNGDGGDELFAGYRRYVAAVLADRFGWLRTAGRIGAASVLRTLGCDRRRLVGFIERLIRGVSRPSGERYLIWTTDALLEAEKRLFWRGGSVESTEGYIDSILPKGVSALKGQMQGDRKIILPALLVKMDMATMLASVEARSPLLDHELGELAASLPDDFLVRGTRTKAILRDAYRDHLPMEVMTGEKRGFEIPLQRWLNTDLRPMLHDFLGSPNAHLLEFIEPAFLRTVLSADALRERNRGYILYGLLVLEMWLRSMAVPCSNPEVELVA